MQAKPILTTAALVVAALLLVGGVPAIAGTITWKASGVSMGGNWNDTSHWVGGALPTANDPVVFPANSVSSGTEYTVTVNISSAAAQTLDVHADARLDITAGNRLEIGSANSQTSNVDGVIRLTTSSSVLRFMYDHTMQPKTSGSNGLLTGQDNGAVIDDDPSNTRTLTIAKNGTGYFVIQGALKVQLNLINDSRVAANDGTASSDTLTLDTGSYSGTEAGSGEYVISDADATLDVNQDVCTTGNLSFTAGTVDVAPGKSFKAGGSCS